MSEVTSGACSCRGFGVARRISSTIQSLVGKDVTLPQVTAKSDTPLRRHPAFLVQFTYQTSGRFPIAERERDSVLRHPFPAAEAAMIGLL